MKKSEKFFVYQVFFVTLQSVYWKDARVVEAARLESV